MRLSCICLFSLLLSCTINNITKYDIYSTTQKSYDPVYKSVVLLSRTKTVEDEMHEVSATGVVVKTNKDFNYILTVAHFCEETNLDVSIKSTSNTNDEYHGQTVSLDDKLDLCLIRMPKKNNFFVAIKLAAHEPDIGSDVSTIGAPLSIFPLKNTGYVASNFIPSKKEQHFCKDCKLFVITVPSIEGSSGSPVYNSNYELVGIINGVYRRYEHLTIAIRLSAVEQFFTNIHFVVNK